MNNVHNTQCLCGKGIAHSHFNNKSFHAWITCPDCARKYHAHVHGLLPRHIPVRYPKNRLERRIRNLEWYIHYQEPLYKHDDEMVFLSDEEKEIMYGPKWREQTHLYSYFTNEKSNRIFSMQRAMRYVAYNYSKLELLQMHDALDDSIYHPEVEKLMHKHRTLTEDDMQQVLRRAVIDYEKHKEACNRWIASKDKSREELSELYTLRAKQREELERQWEEAVIPWDALQEIK